MNQSVAKIVLWLVVVGSAFGSGVFFGKNQTATLNNGAVAVGQSFSMDLFWNAYQKLKTDFFKPENFNNEKILYGAIKGMTRSLDDPYTEFLEPQVSKRFLDDIAGEFGGIGIEIGMRKGYLTVIAPLEGTPGQKAGLKAGDRILKIDDHETIDMGVQEAVDLIRGKENTKVKLLIFRDSFKSAKDFEIVRGKISIPSTRVTKVGDRMYHVQLFNFNEHASQEFDKVARSLIEDQATTIILDLRNNPGGLLDAAVAMGGWFFDQGTVVTKEVRQKKVEKVLTSSGPGSLKNTRIIVLLNEGSASASEILAGALKDNLGALIIGQKSFGKGSIQVLDELPGGATLKYTIAEWARPNGEIINGKGILPDIEVKEADDTDSTDDPVLKKAIEKGKAH